MSILQRALRAAACGFAAVALAAQASATWSIVILNRATGEIAVGQATCIAGTNLLPRLAAVRTGKGVGIVQAWWDADGDRRELIAAGLDADKTPQQILDDLNQLSSPQIYQFGIVSFAGPAVTFTGTSAMAGVCGIAGEAGPLSYAIQGNVMTGAAVCAEAEARLLAESGDMVAKLMAAMDGARSMGGDGRCSCDQSAPTSCGTPPPSFTKSAHTGFVLVSRMGDVDGTCDSSHCANGAYYMKRIAVGAVTDPDPVDVLAGKVANWRANLAGRPDQLLTQVQAEAQQLPANGTAETRVLVRLIGLNGLPLLTGGQTVTIEPAHIGPDPATPGPAIDRGDGTHEFTLRTTTQPGTGTWHIRVDDGQGQVLLWPPLNLSVLPPAQILASRTDVSAASPAPIDLFLDLGAASQGALYQVLGNTSGPGPGIPFGNLLIPLQPDRLLALTSGLFGPPPGPPLFQNMQGTFNPSGRATARVQLAPTSATPMIGQTLRFLGAVRAPSSGQSLTTIAAIDVLP